MPLSLELTFQETDARVKHFRASAEMAVSKADRDVGAIFSRSSGGMYGSGPSLAQHEEQYRYFRGPVYAAIRPIAVRIAGQSFRAGNRPDGGPSTLKAHKNQRSKGYHRAVRCHLRKFKSAPQCILKRARQIEILETHTVLDVLEDPNDFHTEWMLKYCVAVSLMLSGKAYWWFDWNGSKKRWEVWPVPASWISPVQQAGFNRHGWAKWEIRMPGSTEPITVDGADICYFFLPDPSDPRGAVSPLQANAHAVSTDEAIANCQHQGFKNGIKPSVIIKAGRAPAMPGMPANSGQRVMLTATQRKQLIEAIKWAYQGWEHHNDPAIVDGLIEDIIPWGRTNQEMDYQGSGKYTFNRIMLGFGVNPTSIGEIEGGNRAQAYVADENLASNTINPLIEMISQVATKRLGPKFAKKGEKLYVWIEAVRPHDAELELKQWVLAMNSDSATQNEYREYLGLPPRKGGDKTRFEREQGSQQSPLTQQNPGAIGDDLAPEKPPKKLPKKPVKPSGKQPVKTVKKGRTTVASKRK